MGAVAALLQPALFTWIPTSMITYLLAATMLGMGLTMSGCARCSLACAPAQQRQQPARPPGTAALVVARG